MTPVWNESFLRIAGRWGLAMLGVFVLLVLSAFPFQVAHLGEIRPAFMLMAVYYWAILQPPMPLAAFLLGLVLDLVSAYPLGMNALVLVAVQWLTSSQRKFFLGQSFLVIWACFALVAFGSGLVQWALFSLFDLMVFSPRPMLVSTLLSAFLFPLVVLPLGMAHKALVEHPSSVP
jgi:rod shape-determining protein MreD